MSKIRHIKSGKKYETIGEARAEVSGRITNPERIRQIRDGDILTVYRGEDGKLWVRFSDEFFGRFSGQ